MPLRRPRGETVAEQRRYARYQEGFGVVVQALQSEDELARSVTEDIHAKIRQIREPDADLDDDTGRGEPWVRCHSQVGIPVPEASETDQQFGGRRESSSRRFDSQTVSRQTTSESTTQLGEPPSDP